MNVIGLVLFTITQYRVQCDIVMLCTVVQGSSADIRARAFSWSPSQPEPEPVADNFSVEARLHVNVRQMLLMCNHVYLYHYPISETKQ